MSEPMFPVLPGLAWNVTRAPIFQTRIQRAVSGRELRALDYPLPLWKYTLSYEFLRDDSYDELRTLLGFYLQRQGAFGTFLYVDPTDNSVTGQAIAVSDGVTTRYQLVRSLGGFVEPMRAPVSVTTIRADAIDTAGYWGVDPATGIVAFSVPPYAGAVISADFTYAFRCRFVDDSYDFENFMARLWQLKKLDFVTVPP